MNKSSFNFDKKRLILSSVAAACALAMPRGGLRSMVSAAAALGLGSALLKPSANEASIDANEQAAPELIRTALVNGITMRWEEHGDSDPGAIPVIMVHGIPTHPRLWRYVIPQVCKPGVRCLAWELVGFGWSMEEGFERDISLPKQADYLYDWLQHMNITQAVFVGHDLGGGVLQELLVRHPELSSGLVLVDSVAYDNWPVPTVRLAKLKASVIEQLPPSLFKPLFLSGVYNLGHDNEARRQESISLHWQPYSRTIGPKAFAHQISCLDSKDTQALAGKLSIIRGPKRIVWGDSDSITFASGQQLAAELNASLVSIPGGRHFNPEDHPSIVSQAISEVLQLADKNAGVDPLVAEGAELA
ncbi:MULTISPECIES: alpha/beta fold hydrolase [Pseudomonas]|uniref:Pimeloyl-ACP methyl ester carboxylesterase n=1 Tax=Pseudomonas lutea TaxID=243924 RepID=A0A9X8MD14_9PSED|nr:MULTISPECIES: alpha/beta hydrolase [Pseudomonas]SEQ56739.1 Pimeloyl-ACP methyl ester carboxylesterase [Pseudomonas lutea]